MCPIARKTRNSWSDDKLVPPVLGQLATSVFDPYNFYAFSMVLSGIWIVSTRFFWSLGANLANICLYDYSFVLFTANNAES